MVWYDMLWYGMECYDMSWYDMACFDMLRYGMTCYVVVWRDMADVVHSVQALNFNQNDSLCRWLQYLQYLTRAEQME